MINYRKSSLTEIKERAMHVVARNHSEAAEMGGEVDVAWYETYAQSGFFRVYVAEAESGIIGYCVMQCGMSHHFKGKVMAQQDTLYVLPEYRHTRAGPHLLAFADDCLKAEGFDMVYRQSRIDAPCARLLERYGYESVETTYMKRF